MVGDGSRPFRPSNKSVRRRTGPARPPKLAHPVLRRQDEGSADVLPDQLHGKPLGDLECWRVCSRCGRLNVVPALRRGRCSCGSRSV